MNIQHNKINSTVQRPLYTRDEVLQGILDSSDNQQDFSDPEDDGGPMADGFTDLHEKEYEYSPPPDSPPLNLKTLASIIHN